MDEFPSYKTTETAVLVPYARNSRTHSPQQIDKIAASIREFGFLNPVITDGANGIVAGHGRLLAAQKLGLKMLPTIEAAHLTEAQRRAYIIADNRLALDAGWDDDLLKIETDDLQGMDFDLSLTGFEPGEILGLLLDVEEGETNIDEEWEGMPEFDQEDKTSFRHIIVHFANNDDLVEFFSIIGQSHTDKTKSIWFPKAEIETYADKSYE